MKTFSLKHQDLSKEWIIIDAKDVVLGRLASFISYILRGKDKPTYTPHMDCGTNVIVINAARVYLTGKKMTNKVYHWHTGYTGGIKTQTSKDLFSSQHPERVVMKAVQRMMPRTPLRRQQFANLRVYASDSHPHSAQKPKVIEFKTMNIKNQKRYERSS